MLMTAFSSIDRAVEAMQRGAVDYLAKPFSPTSLAEKIRQYSKTTFDSVQTDTLPVVADKKSHDLLKLAGKVAQSNANVLICGESGAGKEILAQYIHAESSRKDKPFVAINCAAIPENMLEAILFGHEKGAFTGAYKSLPGKFELADEGTLLLDEISEMPIGLQAKILRVLQEREVERIGGKTPKSIDVRVIATTNRDMNIEIKEKRFREDLYYRINVFPLYILPLRERKEDIIPLANRLLQKHATDHVNLPHFSQEAVDALLDYSWPGNVRELDNVIQRALVLQKGEFINSEDILIEPSQHQIDRKTAAEELTGIGESMTLDSAFKCLHTEGSGELGRDIQAHEFSLILSTLKKFHGNRKKTADHLGISSRTLRYKIARMRREGVKVEPK